MYIKRERQKVRYHKEFELDNDILTLPELRKYVNEDESFSIIEKENSLYGCAYILSVSGIREETDEEMKERIKKEELYMGNYHKFHNRKKINKK
jgi:hypothetical protein